MKGSRLIEVTMSKSEEVNASISIKGSSKRMMAQTSCRAYMMVDFQFLPAIVRRALIDMRPSMSIPGRL